MGSRLALRQMWDCKTWPQTISRLKSLIECNYLQCMEGEVDSAHVSFLHRNFGQLGIAQKDPIPRYEIEATDFGLRLVASRHSPPDKTYIRLTSFVLPLYFCLPTGALRNDVGGYDIHFFVPLDDNSCWRYDMWFRRQQHVDREAHEVTRKTKYIRADYARVHNLHNDYHINRQLQHTANYTGIEDIVSQDAAVTESMGPICDRTKEQLGVSDSGVIALRRKLLRCLKSFQEGGEPAHIIRNQETNHFPHIDSFSELLEPGEHWRDRFKHLTGGVTIQA